MFVSSYETSLDSKGRVSVPAPFRHALEGSTRLYLWPASDGSPCLEGGGEALMASYRQTLSRMSPNSKARRVLMHRIVSKAADLKIDDTGRIKIPETHLGVAGITKNLIFVGSMDRFHVWAPDRYATFDAEMDGLLPDVQDAIDAPFHAALAQGGIVGVVGGEDSE
ncbi:MAG: division/cell wall cluster transcriptional repressor MraZ [Pseudomonadota bacterium]